jgi:hypothetical protein
MLHGLLSHRRKLPLDEQGYDCPIQQLLSDFQLLHLLHSEIYKQNTPASCLLYLLRNNKERTNYRLNPTADSTTLQVIVP